VKAFSINAVIHAPHAIGIDTDTIHDILDGAIAVTHDKLCPSQGTPFRGHMAAVPCRDKHGIQRARDRWLVCGVHVVDPRHVLAVQVAAIRNHTAAATANYARVTGRNCRQQRLAEAVDAKWTGHVVDVNLRQPDEIRRDTVRNEMKRTVRLSSKIGRKRVIGRVHPAKRDEVTRGK
jgi:hypothetical protein